MLIIFSNGPGAQFQANAFSIAGLGVGMREIDLFRASLEFQSIGYGTNVRHSSAIDISAAVACADCLIAGLTLAEDQLDPGLLDYLFDPDKVEGTEKVH